MKVRERSDTRLVLESFTWDIALVISEGALGGRSLVICKVSNSPVRSVKTNLRSWTQIR